MTSLPWAMTTLLKTRRATVNSYRKHQDQNWRCTRAMKSERWRKSGKAKQKHRFRLTVNMLASLRSRQGLQIVQLLFLVLNLLALCHWWLLISLWVKQYLHFRRFLFDCSHVDMVRWHRQFLPKKKKKKRSNYHILTKVWHAWVLNWTKNIYHH